MNQYRKIFGVTRIPLPVCDALVIRPESRHIVVLARNHIYRVVVYNETTGQKLSELDLAK